MVSALTVSAWALPSAVAVLAQAMVAVAAGLVSLVALTVSAWALPSAVAVIAQAMVAMAAGLVSLVADCFGDCFALVPSRQRQRPEPNRC